MPARPPIPPIVPQPQMFTCYVNQAGVELNPPTPDFLVMLQLSDVNGAFDHTWFSVANVFRREALAVALAAISNQMQVNALLLPPGNAPGSAITECSELFIVAS